MKKPIKLIKSESEPEPPEIIARSIIELAEGMRKLDSTRLSRKAIVTLLHDSSKISKRDINVVLDNLASLERDWLKDV